MTEPGNSILAPLTFISCFSFANGCLHPQTVAEYLFRAGFKHFPITEISSSAGLLQSLNAAQKFNLMPLYGQIINIEAGKAALFPDEHKAAAWLHRICSLIRNNIFQTNQANPELGMQDFAGIMRKFPPCGTGRIIFYDPSDKDLLNFFADSGWKIFLACGDSLNLGKQQERDELSRYFNASQIYAPEIVALNRQDQRLLRLIKAISTGQLAVNVTDEPPVYSPDSQVRENAAAIANNLDFVHQPTWVPETGRLKMPVFSEDKFSSFQLLQEKCRSGMQKKYQNLSDKLTKRLELELKTIAELGFVDYFLLVDEITLKAKELGVRVLGRGSAANSLVSYLLDFTQVDPIKYDLYFERFLNPHRKSPPDIDLDFSWKIRDQIYQFLRQRWGEDRVALISTHISLSNRSAVRETGKALGISNEELGYLSSLLGHSTVGQFIADPAGKARYRPNFSRLKPHLGWLKLAAKLEGLPTHFSIHAGGVVISPDSLFNYSIIQPSSKVLPITHCEMRACEQLGLVKFDLLSQRALGVYAELSSFEPARIPHDPEKIEQDEKVQKSLAAGDTLGVFYIESPGMRGLLAKLKCRSFSQLVAASSIIRPGVAESGMMQEYIKRHLNPRNWKPLHPLFAEILGETYGIMVYQEDVMKIAHHLAGFSLAEADVLRRAMSGKERSTEQMQSAKNRFLQGTAAKGIKADIAREIWRQISSFCGYAFCKAHSAAYAVLSLELLWAKIYLPELFFAAVLNNRGGFYGPQAYVSAAIRSGIKIHPPNVNSSTANFSMVKKGELQTGLSFITSLKATTCSRIIEQRADKPFSSLLDFIERVAPAEDEFDNLVSSGSLQDFGNKAWCRWQFKTTAKSGLFAASVAELPIQLKISDSKAQLVKDELKSMGFTVSGHPGDLFPRSSCNSANLCAKFGQKVKVTGLLIATKSVITSRQEKMKFLTLEDDQGLIEVIFFPEAWKKAAVNLDQASVITVGGLVKTDSGQLIIHGQTIQQPGFKL